MSRIATRVDGTFYFLRDDAWLTTAQALVPGLDVEFEVVPWEALDPSLQRLFAQDQGRPDLAPEPLVRRTALRAGEWPHWSACGPIAPPTMQCSLSGAPLVIAAPEAVVPFHEMDVWPEPFWTIRHARRVVR